MLCAFVERSYLNICWSWFAVQIGYLVHKKKQVERKETFKNQYVSIFPPLFFSGLCSSSVLFGWFVFVD